MEFLKSLLGGAVGAAVVAAIFKIVGEALAARRARKEKLEDRALDKAEKQAADQETLEEKFEAFVKKQEMQNASMRQRMEGVEAAVTLNTEVSISSEYTAIRKEACAYIKHGSVDPIDRAELKARYSRYLKLIKKDKDDSLIKFLDEVERLRPEPLTLDNRKN